MNSKAHTISLLLSLSLQIILVVRCLREFGTTDHFLPTSWHLVTLVLLGAATLFLIGPLRRGSLLHRIFGGFLGLFPLLLFGLYGYSAFKLWKY